MALRHDKNKGAAPCPPFSTTSPPKSSTSRSKIGATILAHYYQEGEIQALADITGDSLKLAREATKVDSPVIVFCGVLFMAETAKMLNPSKKVLLPDLQGRVQPRGRVPRRTSSPATRRCSAINGRKFQTVMYINSSAKVKALSDWVVTSGNAEDVVRNKVPAGYEILFVPDKHLGRVPAGGDRPRR